MRLIDADAAIQEIDDNIYWTDSEKAAIRNKIYRTPTIDPESLRPQGEWISRFARHWKGRDECSRCGFHEKDHRDLSHYNYCPNCVAKMKGEQDAEN